ncbi:Pyrophosphatase PpaX [Aliiroseovarius sp. xm-m-379]|uniref:HAD-IA family hydrolase n=1 Tax=unclassified Aliiroseovarius TaxID=2623558 RepID=UPI0015692B9C|nr:MULTISPECIES: HAD-IA family hydrolase [unclassified Aliiroseovarius]NRP12850.1 Pyrophosphatase PpaX [Aliiroseovarius sp. xm-d-517]NRP24317.1 Pyrophosphatase PpaX [Aliiroseovarius sp. xm-m-379]NRP29871.1 Pyrophosphatase PpaX [Aliiroseovarius sp. xm-m-314]NRP33116.1 Pyrophosphatase PpaX [Aliiroseovarius sp. xm-a-104]NRP39883.1 Pyrophosphatase PpaX [Aliiroseovarius sp. xm-m-339-2]
MSDLKLVVFDVDGTLIDSQDFIVEAMSRAFAEMGVAIPTRKEILSIVGLSLHDAIATLVPAMPEPDVARAAEGYKDMFIKLRAEKGGEAAAPMYPGARAVLEQLHARDEVLLGVATGKAKRGLDHAYQAHDIGHFFLTSQTADNHPSKPHPSMLHATLAETGADAQRAVMIGDTTFDISMGVAAGFRTIGVTWGYHDTQQLLAAGADLLIDSYDALIPALETLWGME